MSSINTSQIDSLNFYFVLPENCEDELSTDETMQSAFELLRNHGANLEWIKEENCIKYTFKKTDVVVFQSFEGKSFEYVTENYKCLRVLGPRCIITCLAHDIDIPNNGSPVFNFAMLGLTVTLTNIRNEKRANIEQKIKLMGGICIRSLTKGVTHLIVEHVPSVKYYAAIDTKIPVLIPNWVEDVWKLSNEKADVKAVELIDKYKCPALFNVNVCSTNFSISERNKIQKIVEENGGKLSGKMCIKDTNILICNVNVKSSSDKHRVAARNNIPCVNIDWLHNSIESGYYLPVEKFDVKYRIHSTPTKDTTNMAEFSMMSCIASHEPAQEIDETNANVTQMTDISIMKPATKLSCSYKTSSDSSEDVLNSIDMAAIKSAGLFLDNCSIYLMGFNDKNREKLCRILKSAGATRYDKITDRVTHIVVGNPTEEEKKNNSSLLQSGAIVSINWVLESAKLKQPAPEEAFIVDNIFGNQKVTTSPVKIDLGNTLKVPVPNKTLNEEMARKEDQTFINTYLQSKNDEVSTFVDTLDEDEDDSKCTAFEGKSFKLFEYPELKHVYLAEMIINMGGRILETNSKKERADYLVSAIYTDNINDGECVNEYWLQDCYTNSQIVEIECFHRPMRRLPQNSTKPLQGCVVTVSGYSRCEREFVSQLILYLGGTFQEKFTRVDVPSKSLKKNTHLVCPEPKGQKYEAAVKWDVWVVTLEWLLEINKTATRISEDNYCISNKRSEKPSSSSTVNETWATDAFEQGKSEKLQKPSSSSTLKFDNETWATDAFEKDKENDEIMAHSSRTNATINQNEESNNSLFDNNDNNTLVVTKRASDGDKDEGEPTKKKQKFEKKYDVFNVDGKEMNLSGYMSHLRNQGLLDPPSPPTPIPVHTPISEVIRRTRATFASTNPIKLDFTTESKTPKTPVSNHLKYLKQRNILPGTPGTPDSPTPRACTQISTPEAPLGAFYGKDPSPKTRKAIKKYLDNIPVYSIHKTPEQISTRRRSTPLKEVIAWAWDKLLENQTAREQENSTPPPHEDPPQEEIPNPSSTSPKDEEVTKKDSGVDKNLVEFQDLMLNRRRSEINTPRRTSCNFIMPNQNSTEPTQEDGVGWEYDTQPADQEAKSEQKYFMMSGLKASLKDDVTSKINILGGRTSETFDFNATHLLCDMPSRSEKLLGSMASGKWILHYNYILDSFKANKFLNEEEYEFGNKKFKADLDVSIKAGINISSYNWWRENYEKTKKKAFEGMRTLIFSSNQQALTRFVEAGGGKVISNMKPPFSHSVDVTHCLIDFKLDLDMKDFVPLAEQKIICVSVMYLSNYLNNMKNIDFKNFVPKPLLKYYD